MNIKECENCIFYVLEPDMSGSGYYICANKNYKSSWPEFTGKCPYLKFKPDIIYKELKDLKNYYHNHQFALIGERRYQALCDALEIIKNVKEEDRNE